MLVKAASRCLMGVRCLAFAALLARALPGQMLPLDRLRSPVDSVRTQTTTVPVFGHGPPG